MIVIHVCAGEKPRDVPAAYIYQGEIKLFLFPEYGML